MSKYTRREFLNMLAGSMALSYLHPVVYLSRVVGEVSQCKRNVLFIAVDDLRTQLRCYGHEQMITPNIDKLAKNGTVFSRAYCQWPVCGPSRASILTGLRPDTTKIYSNGTKVKDVIPDIVSLPRNFRNHGYHTVSLGKVYHSNEDDIKAWSEHPWRASGSDNWQGYASTRTRKLRERLWEKAKKSDPNIPFYRINGEAVECTDLPDDKFVDGQVARRAVKTLRRINGNPFFLAVGFVKPHLPFACPRKYWDLYRREEINLSDNPLRPYGVPDIVYIWSELHSYYGVAKDRFPSDDEARELIHGYYACVSFIDAQIGLLLDELERLGLDKNTVIVLWGDHGFHLGDQSIWGKHTNFENAVRAPLIVSAPGQRDKGKNTDALVEFVDVYPTLCELCEIPKPEHLEGTSFVPVLEDSRHKWKKAAFSQYKPFKKPYRNIMGYTIRTERYRYTEWQDLKNSNKVIAEELYDHNKDPKESINVFNKKKYAEVVKQLSKLLKRGWRAALPD